LAGAANYASHDYAAAIIEERQVYREKYSDARLIASFLQASPPLASAVSRYNTTSEYTDNEAITVTAVFGNKNSFYVTCQTRYNSMYSTSYKLRVQISQGNITVPQLGGKLAINGRESKIHMSDYDVGGFDLL
jgi:hypothetical protein